MVFILALIAIIALVIVVVAAFSYSNNNMSGLAFGTGLIGAFVLVVMIPVYFALLWSWYASESKAKIINAEYGTHYTPSDIFYASDVIDTIQQIKRKRVEVNGDLFREEKK